MENPTSAAIMNIHWDELKYMVYTDNIENNERQILCPKIINVPNTGVNENSKWKSSIRI